LIFPEINQQVSETTQQFTLDQGIQQVTNHSQEILYNQVQNSTPIRLQPVYYYHPLAIFNYLLLLNQAANPQPSAQSSSRELNKIQHNTEPTKSVEKKPAEIKEKIKKKEHRLKDSYSGVIHCPECNKTIHATSLKIHMRIHTQETPYHCLVCNQSCNYLSNMIRHTTSIKHIKKMKSKLSSPEKKEFLLQEIEQHKNVCNHCYVAFDYEHELKTHPCKHHVDGADVDSEE
jgi:transcription elongation factor Elf1